jgi:dTDP-4-dehydrorhamnose reductase
LSDASLAWITGGHGLIGNQLVQLASQFAPNIIPRPVGREQIDLLDFDAVTALFRAQRPGWIIHCAALSQYAMCEANPEFAHKANVGMTRHLLTLARDIPFIFFSTDLIFDGDKGNYVEEDPPRPLSVYGRTKADAEDLVRRHPTHLIVRISLTGGHSPRGNRGFNEEMKNAWRAGKTLNLFTDEFRCPASADIIARAVWELIIKNARGTFHLCGAERLSRFEIGRLLALRHPAPNPKINATSRKTYEGPPRPPDTSMNCAKAQRLLSFELPSFSDWLANDTTGF